MKQRVIAFILTAFVLPVGAFVGCTANESDLSFESIEYVDYDPFRFYCYYTPVPANRGDGDYKNNPSYQTDEQYRYIAECGFNYAVGVSERTVEENIKALEGLQPYGVKFLINEPSVGRLCALYNHRAEGKEYVTDELINETKIKFAEMYDFYSQYDSFGGFSVKDEPIYTEFTGLGQGYEYFKEIDGDRNSEWWINLFPNWGQNTLKSTFNDYIDTAAKVSGSTYICYDRYPLYADGNIEPGYWTEIETVARISRKNNKDFTAFILCTGHQTYKKVKTYDDLAYQVYSLMMFGAKGVNTFKYWSTMTSNYGAWSDSLISRDGKRTSLYYGMQQVISEVRAYESIYMNSEWKGVMTYSADKLLGNDVFDGVTAPLEKHDRIKSFTGKSDFAIAAYEDKDGRDGFLVFNANNPEDDTVNEITIKFNDANYAYLYKNGRKLIVKLNGGVFKTTMNSCNAYYIVPVKI